MSAFFEILRHGIEKHKIPLVIFTITLFLLVGCTLPKLFINDEWITLNQLSQIDRGHQIITNEGKYGMLENGTANRYFQVRGNYLGYSIFLPLISLPAQKSLIFFNDAFIYILMVFWTLLLIGIAMFIRHFFPAQPGFRGFTLSDLMIILGFLLFFANLIFYKPFFFIGKETYSEIAAISLTNLILLSLLSVILYQIYRCFFESEKIAISSTIISICCSSFIFWTTNAKDHMLVALLFSVLIYCGIKYFFTGDRWFIPSFFIVVGLIAWARTEIAPPLFILFSMLVVIKSILTWMQSHDIRSSLLLLLSPLFTIIGAIPFFINNYYVTGNFLVPPILSYAKMTTAGIGMAIVEVVNSTAPSATSALPVNQNSVAHMVTLLMTYYSFSPDTTLTAIIRLFILPANHSTGLFIICPLLVIGLISAVFSKVTWKTLYEPEKNAFLFLICLIIIIFVSYLPSVGYMSVSHGITPDVRYFSPMYLPFAILGLVLIKKSGFFPNFSKNGMVVILFTLAEITCILGIFLWLFIPADKNFNGFILIFRDTLTVIIVALVLLYVVFSIFIRNRETRIDCCTLLLHAIIIVPFIWQMVMIFSSEAGIGLSGYTYWIPAFREPMERILAFYLQQPVPLS